MMQVGSHWYRCRRGDSVAVRLGRVRLADLRPAVLSRAAADPDRGAGLEPLGGAGRRGVRLGRPRRGVRRLLVRGVPVRHRAAGVVARLSRAAGAADRTAARRTTWNGIRSAIWWFGPRSSARSIVIAALINFGTGEEGFRAALRSGLERMLRLQTRAPKGADAATSTGWSISWCWRCRRPRPCSPPSPMCSTCGSPGGSSRMSGRLQRPPPDLPAMQFPVLCAAADRRRDRGLVPARA